MVAESSCISGAGFGYQWLIESVKATIAATSANRKATFLTNGFMKLLGQKDSEVFIRVFNFSYIKGDGSNPCQV